MAFRWSEREPGTWAPSSPVVSVSALPKNKNSLQETTQALIRTPAEVIGYIGRTVNALEDVGCWTMGPYIVQNIFLLIAPAMMAASIYMILGRIILLTEAEHHAVIRRRWSTKLFVSGDVLSLLMQASGGGIMAMGGEDNNNMEIGEYVIIGGLFVQLFVFGFFVVSSAIFHRRMNKAPTAKGQDPLVRWRWYLMTLYVTSALIWVRSVFRAIEYIEGNKGYLMTTEAFLFVFDSVLIFVCMIWMNWFHPSEIGMLLRGEEPIKNGLELMKWRSTRAKLSSAQNSRDGQPYV